MSFKLLCRTVLILVIGGLTSVAVLSQGLTSGTVSGTVTDPNGAGVPGAVVKVQSLAAGTNPRQIQFGLRFMF